MKDFRKLNKTEILNKYPHLKGRDNVSIFQAMFPLDVASKDEIEQKILSIAAFERMDVKDMPVHFSLDNPYTLPEGHLNRDGEYNEIGHILGKSIEEIDGVTYGIVDIIVHPATQRKYIEAIEKKKDQIAPSWELLDFKYQDVDGVKNVIDGDFSGLALLDREFAAYDMGRVLYANKNIGEDRTMDNQVIEKEIKLNVDTSKIEELLAKKDELNKIEESKTVAELKELREKLETESKEKEKLSLELEKKNKEIKDKEDAFLLDKRKSLLPTDFFKDMTEADKKRIDELLVDLDDAKFKLFLMPKSATSDKGDGNQVLNKINEDAKKIEKTPEELALEKKKEEDEKEKNFKALYPRFKNK